MTERDTFSSPPLDHVALGILLMALASDGTETALYVVAMALFVTTRVDRVVKWYLTTHDPLFVRLGIGTDTE
ncbi:hypothetical protein [Halopelagius fulvigenes]|uniref:Uncharacterized protein n=1 Tax=Halopelagius fulvigenes TaxID=1198324 RepID=A0ABD5TYK8_9EURY